MSSGAERRGSLAAASDIIAFPTIRRGRIVLLAGVADGFTKGERIGCVSGIVLPHDS